MIIILFYNDLLDKLLIHYVLILVRFHSFDESDGVGLHSTSEDIQKALNTMDERLMTQPHMFTFLTDACWLTLVNERSVLFFWSVYFNWSFNGEIWTSWIRMRVMEHLIWILLVMLNNNHFVWDESMLYDYSTQIIQVFLDCFIIWEPFVFIFVCDVKCNLDIHILHL